MCVYIYVYVCVCVCIYKMYAECKGVTLNKEQRTLILVCQVNPGWDVAVYLVLLTLAHSGEGLYLCSLSACFAAVGTSWTSNPL